MNFQQLHCFQNVRNDCGLVLTGYEVYTDRFTQDGIRRSLYRSLSAIHRIHKWRTRGKKLGPSHESEALEGKQKLQMKTFSELAECLARIPPKITLYGLLLKYNDVGCLLLLIFSIDLLFAIKRDAYIFKKTR